MIQFGRQDGLRAFHTLGREVALRNAPSMSSSEAEGQADLSDPDSDSKSPTH